MADNQAEDDDDESFGDFKFASLPNQPFPSTSNHMNARDFSAAPDDDDDDDDWGDFLNHSNQINGGLAHPNGFSPSHVSKPFDPFGVSADPTEKHSSHVNNSITVQVQLAPTLVEPEKPGWKKPQGALPLSIFGEKEDEEPAVGHLVFADGGAANVFSNKNGGSVKRVSDSNGAIGISDLISNLYNERPQVNSDNGSISVSGGRGADLNFSGASSNGNSWILTVAAPNPNTDGLNSNLGKLDSDSVDGNEDIRDDEDGWEFKGAESETGIKSETMKAEETKHETTQGAEWTFRFDNGAFNVGDMLDSSSGISDKAGEWHLGFEFSPSSALQDHISPQLGQKNESNATKTGFAIFNQNFGDLKNAHSGSGSNQNLEAPKLADIYPTSVEVLKFDGEAPHGPIDPSLASVSHKSDEWNFGFNFNSSSLVEDSHISESHSKTKSNQDDNNKNFNSSPANTNIDSDVNLFESKGAVTEIGTKHEKSQIGSENRREALPLSIFGDEMPDTDEHTVSQEFSPYAPISPMRNGFNTPGSNISINDLIWNLYSQAENEASPNVTPKASENGIHATPGVLGSNLVTGDDDFDDDFWDFKDASLGTRFGHESAQNTSSNHAPQVSENGLQSSLTVLNSDLINGDDGFEDDSWEFKDAISGTRSQDQASAIDHRDLPTQLSTKLEPLDYVDFYCKLKDELCNAVLFYFQNLKKAQSVAALSGEDAKAKALHDEIQELSDILHQDNIIPNEYLSENHSPRNVYFDELLEVLKEPKFQSLESEYQLASRLLMELLAVLISVLVFLKMKLMDKAEKDMKSAMELLKDAVSTLSILKLGSREEQSNYLTTWSKIAFVCSQELKHGAYIWKQAVQKNVHNKILSNPKGIRYIHALGEIYRVAEIVGASAKFHKPWMLLGSLDPTSLFALLNECYAIWSGSGLEEALFSISNQNNFEPDVISRELLESIKYIYEIDEHALQSYVISGEETTCQLSALPAGFIPGLKMVTWNGKHYFVTLANLWINLISSDPPWD